MRSFFLSIKTKEFEKSFSVSHPTHPVARDRSKKYSKSNSLNFHFKTWVIRVSFFQVLFLNKTELNKSFSCHILSVAEKLHLIEILWLLQTTRIWEPEA